MKTQKKVVSRNRADLLPRVNLARIYREARLPKEEARLLKEEARLQEARLQRKVITKLTKPSRKSADYARKIVNMLIFVVS
jgi:hypothetical protein